MDSSAGATGSSSSIGASIVSVGRSGSVGSNESSVTAPASRSPAFNPAVRDSGRSGSVQPLEYSPDDQFGEGLGRLFENFGFRAGLGVDRR